VCRKGSLEALEAEGGIARKTLPAVLRALIAAGLLSKEIGSGGIPNNYRLHLPLAGEA
jgi:hypothetical protein